MNDIGCRRYAFCYASDASLFYLSEVDTKQDMKGSVRVFCRFRPLAKREEDLGDIPVLHKAWSSIVCGSSWVLSDHCFRYLIRNIALSHQAAQLKWVCQIPWTCLHIQLHGSSEEKGGSVRYLKCFSSFSAVGSPRGRRLQCGPAATGAPQRHTTLRFRRRLELRLKSRSSQPGLSSALVI